MAMKAIMAGIRPYLVGAVGGVAVVALAGFGSGWLVTRGAMQDAVTNARVGSIARICADEAASYWKTSKQNPAALRKWDAWSQREKLAKRFAAGLVAPKADSDQVVNRCADDLMTS